MTRSPFIVRWFCTLAAITLGLAWLHRLGTGELSAPPLSFSGAITWLDHRDTTTAAFALLRVVAMLFGSYVLVITSVAGAAHYLRIPRMSSLVDRITLPFAKGMLGSVALLGVMGAPPATTPPSVQPLGADTMVELPSDSTSTTTTRGPPETDHVTLHLLPDTPAPAPSLPTPISPTTTTAAAATPPAPTAASVSADADSWEIQHGESFWSIAADHLADINGRPMSEHEIASYWRQLVDANRTRLANPHDADLLFTGQVIDLPAIAPG